jgi:ankyrin repeat protein
MIDLNIEDKNGWTPLHHAVRNNALNVIEFLLENGVDDVRLNEQQEAPIHLAILHNQLNALKVCLCIPYILIIQQEIKKDFRLRSMNNKCFF